MLAFLDLLSCYTIESASEVNTTYWLFVPQFNHEAIYFVSILEMSGTVIVKIILYNTKIHPSVEMSAQKCFGKFTFDVEMSFVVQIARQQWQVANDAVNVPMQVLVIMCVCLSMYVCSCSCLNANTK